MLVGLSFIESMKFVERKVTTSISKHNTTDFTHLKKCFLNDLSVSVSMEEIPAYLSLTCDQTGIRIVPSSPWIMEQQGARRAEMIGSGDKRKIRVVFPGSLVGDLYKGKQLNVILNSNSLGP